MIYIDTCQLDGVVTTEFHGFKHGLMLLERTWSVRGSHSLSFYSSSVFTSNLNSRQVHVMSLWHLPGADWQRGGLSKYRMSYNSYLQPRHPGRSRVSLRGTLDHPKYFPLPLLSYSTKQRRPARSSARSYTSDLGQHPNLQKPPKPYDYLQTIIWLMSINHHYVYAPNWHVGHTNPLI